MFEPPLPLPRLLVALGLSTCLGSCAPPDGETTSATETVTEGDSSSTSETETDDPSVPVDPPPGTLLADPLEPFPPLLSEIGLYLDLETPDLERVPRRARPYSPQWPLWTNGSAKQRFLVVPSGATITGDGDGPWVYPAGTIVTKTFLYPDSTAPRGERAVETRLLRHLGDGDWDYAVYRWREDGRDGDLLDIKTPHTVTVTTDDGPLEHTIPSRLQCRACHESAPSHALGVDPIQLAGDGDHAPLQALIDAGVIDAAILAEPQPAIDAADPATAAILGYYYGNCVHCHNGGSGDNNSFDLRPQVALENTIGVETSGNASGAGIRVVPGDPAASLLYLALARDTEIEVKPMPPVGVDRIDEAALTLFRTWIEALPE